MSMRKFFSFLFLSTFIPTAYSQSLRYNFENFSNNNTDSISYGDTVFFQVTLTLIIQLYCSKILMIVIM